METITLPNLLSVLYDAGAPEPVDYLSEELTAYFRKAGFTLSPACGWPIRLVWNAENLSGDSFRITADDNGAVLEGGNPRAVVYAGFAFLESLGFRFLASDCDVIPPMPIRFAKGSFTEAPAFQARELFWRDAMDGAFATRLRLNSARSSITPREGGKLMFYNFSHTFDALVPVARWYDTHPEYFSEVGGKRLRERTQLCLTNPDVLRLCIDGVRAWMKESPESRVFSVSMNDWYNCCQCPSCHKADEEEGSHAGTVIRFVNAIADAVAADNPDVFIHTFAYLYCRKPPRITRPRKNVIVRLCSIECCFSHPIGQCTLERGGIDVQAGTAGAFDPDGRSGGSFTEDLSAWSKICDNLYIWDYTVNYSNYLLPFPNPDVLQANLRLFRDNRVKGVFEQGNFSHGKCAALGQLKTYLLAKLLWNPDADVDAIIRDFVRGFYGKAEKPMLDYVSLWRNAGEEHAGIYDMPDAPYLTEDKIRRSEALLVEAVRLAEGTPELERVEREALSVRYAILAMEPRTDPDHVRRVDAFEADAKRLGITELFERKDWNASFDLLRYGKNIKDRSGVPNISYPL